MTSFGLFILFTFIKTSRQKALSLSRCLISILWSKIIDTFKAWLFQSTENLTTMKQPSLQKFQGNKRKGLQLLHSKRQWQWSKLNWKFLSEPLTSLESFCIGTESWWVFMHWTLYNLRVIFICSFRDACVLLAIQNAEIRQQARNRDRVCTPFQVWSLKVYIFERKPLTARHIILYSLLLADSYTSNLKRIKEGLGT